MLQLAQCLKWEPFHDSALARFLLRRALMAPANIGHVLFWHLQAEMHVDAVRERNGVLLELYLRNCGAHRVALGHQRLAMTRLDALAAEVIKEKTAEARLSTLRREVARLELPAHFQLPLDPDMVVQGIIVEKCRVMESKKKPLWLQFVPVSEDRALEVTSSRHLLLRGNSAEQPACAAAARSTRRGRRRRRGDR